jgi:hypothetical protein
MNNKNINKKVTTLFQDFTGRQMPTYRAGSPA